MSKKGNKGVGVRRGGGSSEARGGREASTTDGPQEPKLLTCGLWAAPAIPPARRTGASLARPCGELRQGLLWPGLLGDKTAGGRAVHLASFAITRVTDKILN